MRLMFVCTGNTCRSPLAVAAWQAVANGPEGAGLNLSHVQVESAGIGALPGLPASRHSVTVAREWGVDLSTHRSRAIVPQTAGNIDLMVTMTEQQALAVRGRYGLGAAQVRTLSSFLCGKNQEIPALVAGLESPWAETQDILDPYGGSLETYRECGTIIHEAVTELAKSLARNS